MKKTFLRWCACMAVLAAVLLLGGCGAGDSAGTDSEAASGSEEASVMDVSLLPKTIDNMEHAAIVGTDSNGDVVWTVKTDEYPRAELSSFSDIGILEDQYFYVENGKVVSLDKETGEKNWENSDFGGAPSQYCHLITEDGKIYLSGYYGPDFYAVDKYGTTLGRIEKVDENCYWPSSMSVTGDQLTITMDGGPGGQPSEVTVDLTDYQGAVSDSGPGYEQDSAPAAQDDSGTGGSHSNEELVQLAGDYYEKKYGDRPPCVEVDSEEGDEVKIHLYENMSDHTATWDWYTINRVTLKGENILGEEIDLGGF